VTELVQEQRLALEPLREALLANAHAEADRLRRGAREDGAQAVVAAEQEVVAMVAQARARGEEDGAELRRADQARVRSAARAELLAARSATYDELRRRARTEVRELLEQPGERELLARALRDRLGGGAAMSDTDDGGLVARAPDGRTIDASVGVLVDRALAGLDLEQLWTAG
jgi:vacuolar-type H+-ATPase subunit E/Vma4